MATVDAILLASGFSRRFGKEDKLLYPIRGKPLAQHTLALACSMGLNRVFFVTARADVAALADGYAATVLSNANPERGMRESIRLGVEASEAEYYLFFACDQPFLDETTVRAIVEWAEPGCIVSPEYEGRPGLPTLFSAAYRDELLRLGAGEHARDVKAHHTDRCRTVPVPDGRVLWDLDRLEDIPDWVAFVSKPDGKL